ncbi:hypothetical protein [Calothrix sp. NIES-3974]|uniref:hypothetical protein n=1 Tax=Calothrix sp. NIES-3974 TaxID=2005462 RepID=UPI000B6110AF|nr:hypothetical protein [Calothrix sp. NIES-3974]BAZ05269.1 hypothetical protein NIES3974_19150 [Calothrix sp. NIES-3974]
MTRLAKSSGDISGIENNEQNLLPNIRNIIVMEDNSDLVDTEDSNRVNVSDVLILLSHRSTSDNHKTSANTEETVEKESFTQSQDNDFTIDEQEQIFQEIRHAISLLSRRPAPPVKNQPKSSESGATRTTKSHNLNPVNQINQIIDSEADEDFQLLTSTFANILTLMSRRPAPPVRTSPKTSEPGATRSGKSQKMVVPTSSIEQQGDDFVTEDEDFLLLTSTFANILTLMSRRPVPPVRTSPKTSESGATRMRSTRSLKMDLLSESEDNIDVIKSTFLNLLTMVSRHPYSLIAAQEDTLWSNAVRVYRIR